MPPTVVILRGGAPVKSPILVNTDKTTLLGDGSPENPLRSAGGGGSTAYYYIEGGEDPSEASLDTFSDYLSLEFEAEVAGTYRVGWKVIGSLTGGVPSAEYQLVAGVGGEGEVLIDGPVTVDSTLQYAGGFVEVEVTEPGTVIYTIQFRVTFEVEAGRALAQDGRIEAWPVTITT